MSLTLEQFAQDLQQSILADANLEDAQDFAVNVFTRKAMEQLAEAGETIDGEVCHYEARGARVNGFAADVENDRLDLMVSIYNGASEASRVDKLRVDAAFKAARGFLLGSLSGLHTKMEESSPAFGLAQIINSLNRSNAPFSRIRIFLLTDGLVNTEPPVDAAEGGLNITHHIRDMEWLFNWWSSGQAAEKIEINLADRPGGPLACLSLPADNGEYQTYLAIVPGELLLSIYSDYGPRLLERNVRSFLQAKGAVNKGIRDTLRAEPQRFLAYNNGLTATAEAVQLTPNGRAIARISDLQIVNGGQTTASIFASRRDKADLSKVFVPLKLSVVRDPEQLDEFVEKIAQFANSQNKVNLADFSANTVFHRRMEEWSRSVWAPIATGAQSQTRWFYERARGQYADARSREGTPAKMKAWDKVHPRSQMFTKTDLAKFEFTWMQRPHTVSRGAQTCFAVFAVELGKREYEPDVHYFEHLCAKAILFRRAEKIIGAQNYGGYRANIVTYTLAYISHATGQRIDLNAIWRSQEITPALHQAIQTVSKHVHDYITHPPGGRNVTQWCKAETCWLSLRAKQISLPAALQRELVTSGKRASAGESSASANSDIESPDENDHENIVAASRVGGAGWMALAAWAKATENLEPWQRKLAFDIGRRVSSGTLPSHKQAFYGLKALEQARELGFSPEQTAEPLTGA